jgi:hypothetical protein
MVDNDSWVIYSSKILEPVNDLVHALYALFLSSITCASAVAAGEEVELIT